jgi:hypothetical protein
MTAPVAKALPHEFAKFLRENADLATLWKVDDNRLFTEPMMGGLYTVDELMDEISLQAGGSEHIYVYDCNIDSPDEVWCRFNPDAVPAIKAGDMGKYRARQLKDFLYFACSPESGSSGEIITLLPGGFEDEEDGA